MDKSVSSKNLRVGAAWSKRTLVLGVLVLSVLALGIPSLLRGIYNLVTLPYSPIDLQNFYVPAYIWRYFPASSIYSREILVPSIDQSSVGTLGSNYPPIVALLFYPLTLVPFDIAKYLWLGINLACIAGICVWAIRRGQNTKGFISFAVVGLVLMLPATLENLLLGQITPVLGLMLLIVIKAGLRQNGRQRGIAAVVLGLLGAIKLWPLLLVGFLLLRRKIDVAVASVMVFAALTLLGWVVVGAQATREYFTDQLPRYGIQMAQSPEPLNQSVWGVASRFFIGGQTTRQKLSAQNVESIEIVPIVASKSLYWASILVYAIGVGLVLLWTIKKMDLESDESEKFFWLIIVFILPLLPFSWYFYSYLLLFPLLLLITQFPKNQTLWILVLSILLLTLLNRYWAYFPPSPFFLGFSFLATLLTAVTLIWFMRVPPENYKPLSENTL